MTRIIRYPRGRWEPTESKADFMNLSERIATGHFGRFDPIPLYSPRHDQSDKHVQEYTTLTRLDVQWGEVLNNLQNRSRILSSHLKHAETLNQSLLAATLQKSMTLSDERTTHICKISLADAVNEKRESEKMQRSKFNY